MTGALRIRLTRGNTADTDLDTDLLKWSTMFRAPQEYTKALQLQLSIKHSRVWGSWKSQ